MFFNDNGGGGGGDDDYDNRYIYVFFDDYGKSESFEDLNSLNYWIIVV